MSTMSRRVQFTVGDRVLEGDVVDRELAPRFNDRRRVFLTVDVDGVGSWRVREDESEDV